jgi:adenine/guanine phosphoribosyltransferase-like PRPP-binding protein
VPAAPGGGLVSVHKQPEEQVSAEQYLLLLDRLKELAAQLEPAPQCVIGMKRSGLFPAVYISHQLELPMLVHSELKGLKHGKFGTALLVDTTAWKGGSLRKAALKLERAGVETVHTAVMYARREPPPNIDGLRYLQRADSIPRVWYE